MTVVIQRLSVFPSEGSHWRELGKGTPSSGSLGGSLCWMLWMTVGMGAGVGARRSVGQTLVPPPWGQMVAALARHRSRPEAGRGGEESFHVFGVSFIQIEGLLRIW